MESSLYNFRMVKVYIFFKEDIFDRCFCSVDLVYCNYYFLKCDDMLLKIFLVLVCREVCDVMVQRYCKEEYCCVKEINKVLQDFFVFGFGWSFELFNCLEFFLRNGGFILECYYFEEFEGILFCVFDIC